MAGDGEELLGARELDADRPPPHAPRHGGDERLQPRVGLGPVGAADVRDDDAYRALGQSERLGDLETDGVRARRGRPHRRLARLDRHDGDVGLEVAVLLGRGAEHVLEDLVRFGEALRDVAVTQPEVVADVLARPWMEHDVGKRHPLAQRDRVVDVGRVERHRLLGSREHGQVLVPDVHELAGGGRRVLVHGDNGRHRLTAEAHAFDREQRPVRDHGAVMGLDLRADQVAADEHPHDARAPSRRAHVEPIDDAVSACAAHDLAVQHPRHASVYREGQRARHALPRLPHRDGAADLRHGTACRGAGLIGPGLRRRAPPRAAPRCRRRARPSRREMAQGCRRARRRR